MSILRKPYEISVWEDSWDETSKSYTERKICVIGSDQMIYGGRALNPKLTRNVNGQKTFSFSMYKTFIDTETGEKVVNPFISYLISERKVKLKYGDKWHDFLIKNITESSTNSENTYELEDANVVELSKAGFGFTFDADLENNMGTAKELADALLLGTNWSVDDETEVFVEKVEEGLVYLKAKKEIEVKHLTDQVDFSKGVGEEDATIAAGSTILAFYSSCSGKPYRFQFIYSKNGYVDKDKNILLVRDDERIITEADCQYYVDGLIYADKPDDTYGFYLPEDFTIVKEPTNDTTISYLYRGDRYGFVQRTKYLPQIDRYVSLYKDSNGKEVYGYLQTKYATPTIVQNYGAGTTFKSKTGWTPNTPNVKEEISTSREIKTGRWVGDKFVSIDEENWNAANTYQNYLFVSKSGTEDTRTIYNSGPKDNRTLIEEMPIGSEWCVKIGALNGSGKEPKGLSISLVDDNKTPLVKFSEPLVENGLYVSKVRNSCSAAVFKKSSRVYVKISANEDFYISEFQFFEKLTDANGAIIVPSDYETQAINLEKTTAVKTYVYFNKDGLKEATSTDDIIYLDPSETYTPLFNDGAQKIRAVEAKESNYFNILQSIAEKFECWLELVVAHEDNGAISGRRVRFKNYVGKTNNACFRYGVNLKDIQRTFASKDIVSKLIVRSNTNELADNGFCSIQRAAANETGENYIYDFQYYFINGLLDYQEYSKYSNEYNKEIKALNNEYANLVEKLAILLQDQTQTNAQLEIENAAVETCKTQIAQIETEYEEEFGSSIGTDSGTTNDAQKDMIRQYGLYKSELATHGNEQEKLSAWAAALKKEIDKINKMINNESEDKEEWGISQKKTALNDAFYKRYARFIQEGTWQSEDYVDDEKYYIDACSVLYNSCYPQVEYTINVVALSALPGYELLDFDLGDQTYAIDPEFFGDQYREQVVVSEMTEVLDNPTQNSIKVQNFKNQFQDLFQKMTATVQQAQYSSGAWQKGADLVESTSGEKYAFLNDALNDAEAKLTAAGAQSVVWDNSGLTITDLSSPANSIKMVGGAILLSGEDDSGNKVWRTGITSEGVSASLITAGKINTGEITIMDRSNPRFKWDSEGIKAYGVDDNGKIDTNKYSIFSSDGLKGIEGENERYSLTWEGLKIAGAGTKNDSIIEVKNKDKKETFLVDSQGNVSIGGTIYANKGQIGGWTIGEEKTDDGKLKGALYYERDGRPVAYFAPPPEKEKEEQEGSASTVLFVGEYDEEGKPKGFAVDENGNVNLSGNITWNTSSSPIKILYYERTTNGLAPSAPTKPYSDYVQDADGDWHTIKQADDIYASYSYNGGVGWTDPIQIEAKDGKDGVSPFLITLTNDSAMIATDESGEIYSVADLQKLTETEVEVSLGPNKLTDNITYKWEAIGGTLQTFNDREGWTSETLTGSMARFTAFTNDNLSVLSEDTNEISDGAQATVDVFYGGASIGSKTFTVVKNKQGTSGCSYKLIVSPNSFNKSVNKTCTPTFSVAKFEKGAASLVDLPASDTSYVIRTESGAVWELGASIGDTTTFYLFVDGVMWDGETVDAVSNGNDGNPGEKGADGADGASVSTVYVYYLQTEEGKTDAPNAPTGTKDSDFKGWPSSGWSLNQESSYQGVERPYLWRSEGKKSIKNKITTYSDWQKPILYSATYVNTDGTKNDKIDPFNYAEYLRTTNFNTDGIYANGDKLYISASKLAVHDNKEQNVFYASGDEKTVVIGGFTVDADSLWSENFSAEVEMIQSEDYGTATITSGNWYYNLKGMPGVVAFNITISQVNSSISTWKVSEVSIVGGTIEEKDGWYKLKTGSIDKITVTAKGDSLSAKDISLKLTLLYEGAFHKTEGLSSKIKVSKIELGDLMCESFYGLNDYTMPYAGERFSPALLSATGFLTLCDELPSGWIPIPIRVEVAYDSEAEAVTSVSYQYCFVLIVNGLVVNYLSQDDVAKIKHPEDEKTYFTVDTFLAYLQSTGFQGYSLFSPRRKGKNLTTS